MCSVSGLADPFRQDTNPETGEKVFEPKVHWVGRDLGVDLVEGLLTDSRLRQ